MPKYIIHIKTCFICPLLLVFLLACSDSGSSTNEVSLSFTDVSKEAGLSYLLTPESSFDRDKSSGGVAVADINSDGYLDFFVAHGTNGSGRLFLNRGDGTFEDITSSSGIVSSSKARGGLFIDLDGNNKLDFILVEPPQPFSTKSVVIYINQRNNTFIESVDDWGLNPQGNTFSVAAGDYDKDGDLDIAIAQFGLRPVAGNFQNWLWENQNGFFVDVTPILPIPHQYFRQEPESEESYQWNFTPTFSDMNGDGFLDLLYVANYVNSKVYLNDRGLSFNISVSDFTDEGGMGSAVGDYDNDGDFDWFVSSIWHPDKTYDVYATGNSGNRLYNNNGQGVFSDLTDKAGVREGFFGWGACFADFDSDGDLDLFQLNGFGDQETEFGQGYIYFLYDPAVLFLNKGNGSFTEVAFESGIEHTGQGRGVSCLDYDNDGYVDILISNNGSNPTLYKNTVSKVNNYLHVKLEGLPSNSQGVGAKIWIHIGDQTQLRELRLGSNYLSNNPLIAYFGLGKANHVDKVEVVWGDNENTKMIITDVQANTLLTVKHPTL
jgi:hypothetical protein